MGKLNIEERPEWRWWVTPKPLEAKPIHRWCVFPHSFTSELVHAFIDEWSLTEDDLILDPFAGAGTTILAAKEKGIPAIGYDLSPFSVFVSKTKIANYSIKRLEKYWQLLSAHLNPAQWNGAKRDYPDLVRKALPGKLIGSLESVDQSILDIEASESEHNFLRLALLTILPYYSRAVASGGWLKWVKRRENFRSIPLLLEERVRRMMKDVNQVRLPRKANWDADIADARALPDENEKYSAIITSPPYPNRHDYTRVFGVELMFGFLDWEETRRLRYQSFHSHPEARPNRPPSTAYMEPKSLIRSIRKISGKKPDHRVIDMLKGYFLDMYLVLLEANRVCRPGGEIAFVVGNAQYYGEPIMVDELTAEVGEQAGLICDKLLVARYRGNSAQQMGRYGRNPSRESIVIFRKPSLNRC